MSRVLLVRSMLGTGGAVGGAVGRAAASFGPASELEVRFVISCES